ncbi:hypothetical protein ABZ807_23305 [Micromonospora sp. NPDC047548]|uniref:hypothetical protein n=1 Tax=Micromonospora sp. NPDC047548 TaxID=3155624 RepID=UPI0033C97C7F
MTGDGPYEVRPIGRVESPLIDADLAPRQGDEGSPEAWLVFSPTVGAGMIGLHRVRVLAVDGLRVRVADLEALDVKPVLDPRGEG